VNEDNKYNIFGWAMLAAGVVGIYALINATLNEKENQAWQRLQRKPKRK
jgi:hypothetical protein